MTTETRAQVVYHEIWLTAMRQSEPVVLEFKTPQEAATVRMALYNAVKKIRGDESLNPEVFKAIGEVSIHIQDKVVTLRRKLDQDTMQVLLKVINKDKEEIQTSEEQKIEEMQRRFLQREEPAGNPSEDVPAKRTPYY